MDSLIVDGIGCRWVAVAALIVTLGGCGSGSQGATQFAQGSAASTAGGGIGAATLSWQAPDQNTDGTPLTDLAGYKIYFGTAPNDLSREIDVAGVGVTNYVVDNLPYGTYYFSIRAYTSTGVESALSGVVSDKIG